MNKHEIDHSIDIDALAKELAGNLSLDEMRRKQGGTLSTGGVPKLAELVPITEEGRKHLERLRGDAQPAPPQTRSLQQPMSWEDARRKVWALFEMRAAHISQIEDRDFNWAFDENDLETIRNMIRYFTNDRSCAWPLTKGLFVYGLPGTGKTEIMQVMEKFTRENDLPKSFEFTSMSETYTKAKVDSKFDPITPNIQLDRCLDEFGRYTGAVTNFGESLDINEVIIEQRYPRYRNGGQLTHIIANISPNQTAPILSGMIFDRIGQMCTSVYFKGQSKRK